MTEYYFDPADGTVYELPPIEKQLARDEAEWDMNEDKHMEDWRERLEERDG